MSDQDRVVDLEQGFFIWESHVEYGEEGDEARVSFIASTTGLVKNSHTYSVQTLNLDKTNINTVYMY